MGGGLAASAEIIHRKANIDYCVVGDGEIIVKNLIKAIETKYKLTDEQRKNLTKTKD